MYINFVSSQYHLCFNKSFYQNNSQKGANCLKEKIKKKEKDQNNNNYYKYELKINQIYQLHFSFQNINSELGRVRESYLVKQKEEEKNV